VNEQDPKPCNCIQLIRTKTLGDLTISEAIEVIDKQEKMIEEMLFDACDDCTKKALNKAGYSDEDQAKFVERIKQTIEDAKGQETTGDSAK